MLLNWHYVNVSLQLRMVKDWINKPVVVCTMSGFHCAYHNRHHLKVKTMCAYVCLVMLFTMYLIYVPYVLRTTFKV